MRAQLKELTLFCHSPINAREMPLTGVAELMEYFGSRPHLTTHPCNPVPTYGPVPVTFKVHNQSSR